MAETGNEHTQGFLVGVRTPPAERFRALWESGQRIADTSRTFGPYLDLLEDQDFALAKDPLSHERMMRDCQIRSCIRLRQLVTASRKVEFLPREDSPMGREAAAFATAQWAKVRRPTEVLLNMLDAIPGGVSFNECVWTPDPDSFTWYTRDIVPAHKDRFRFTLQGELAILSQQDVFYGELVPPRVFMHHVYDPEPASFHNSGSEAQLYYGRGEFDRIYPWFLWKQLVLRLGFAYLDRLAYPIKVGRYPYRDATARAELLSLLQGLSHHRTVAWPGGDQWELDLIQTSATGHNVGMDYLNYIDTQMAKVILGSTLLQEPGERGSFGLGAAHIQSVFGSIVQADSANLCDTLEHTWVRWLFEVNNRPVRYAPKVTQAEGKTQDTVQTVDVLLTLADRGYPISIEQVAEMTGVRPAREGETLLGLSNPVNALGLDNMGANGIPGQQGSPSPQDLLKTFPQPRAQQRSPRVSMAGFLGSDRGICEKGTHPGPKKLDVDILPEHIIDPADVEKNAKKSSERLYRPTTKKTVSRKLGPVKYDKIASAASKNRMISFEYVNLKGEDKKYRVEPYSYRYRRGYVYLYGFDPAEGHIKSFFAHKLRNIRSGRKFEPRYEVEIGSM